MTQTRIELPGPTAEAFYRCNALVSAIMGPVGGGKTTTCFYRGMRHATEQVPSPRDGIARFRLYTVRDTYRNLWGGTLPSWWAVIPRNEPGSKFIGSEGEPAKHVMSIQVERPVVGQTVTTNSWISQFEHEFYAIGEHSIEEFMRGKEPTAWNFEEADLLSREMIEKAIERAGRYPRQVDGGPTWYGVMQSFNAPDVENFEYDMMVANRMDGFEFFHQPSGLSPQAENRKNLPPQYYENMLKVLPDWEARRKIHAQWGYSREGKPVYLKEFDEAKHIAKSELEPIRGLRLIVGFDAGMDPAAVIMQHAPNGQWRWLDELVSEHGTGPKRFARNLNQLLAERYSYFDLSVGSESPQILAYADPSSFYGADTKEGDQPWASIVMNDTGLVIRPAGTSNRLTPRLEAVRYPLTHDIEAGVPGMLISPRCKMVLRGMTSQYRYRKEQVPGQTRYSNDPEKTEASHVMEAGQYGVLGGGGMSELLDRKQENFPSSIRQPAITDWEPIR